MNTASNTRLRLTTQVGQVHVATGVLLNLGTNFQPHRPENAAEHQTSSPLTKTSQTSEHHRSDRSLLVKLGDFHRVAPHRSGRVQHTGQTGLSQKAPKHQTTLLSSKLTQTRNSCNTGQQRTHPNVHLSKDPTGVAPVRPV
jgi:negative regulator of sigma E activity